MRTHWRSFLSVLFLLLAGNLVHAASPEVAIADPVLGPAPFARWQPSIATNGKEFLAVWTDSRVTLNAVTATRLDEQGNVLDGPGIAISAGTDFHPALQPRAIWTGSTWLVIWQATLPAAQNAALVAARVDRDGNRVGIPYMLGRGVPGTGQYVAWNGALTVVAATDPAGNVPHAFVLDAEGNLVRDLTLPTSWVNLSHMAVATNGSGFVVAWEASGAAGPEIEAVRIDGSGNLSDTSATILGAGRAPFLASDGIDFMLLSQRMQDERLQWSTTPITKSASLAPGTTHTLPDGALLQFPTIAWRNDHYLVTGQRNSDVELHMDIAAARIQRDGAPDPALTSLGDLRVDSIDPQLAAAVKPNGKFAVVWVEQTAENFSTIATRGRVFDSLTDIHASTQLLSRSADPHYAQSLAFSGSMFLAAWVGRDGVYAARVTPDGHTIDSRGIAIGVDRWNAPATDFDGTNFVVAWATRGSIRLRFVSPQTGLLAETIAIPTLEHDGSVPAIAITSEAIQLAWIDGEHVMMTRIPHRTHIAETPVAVSPVTYAARPQLAWNGSQFLVTWSELEYMMIMCPPMPMPMRIAGARVSAGLNVIDTSPLQIASSEWSTIDNSSIAANGKDWIVVWESDGANVDGRRVFANGQLAETTPIASGAFLPRVIFDGTRYAISWKEYADPHSMLRLGALTTEGAIERSAVANIARTDTRLYAPALAATPFGVAAAYARVSDAPEHGGVERTFLRIMKGSSRKRAVGN